MSDDDRVTAAPQTSRAEARPFVIWTLQRTGGTHLAKNLAKLSGLKSTAHEPFNRDRQYGNVTQRWLTDADLAALDASMAKIAARGEIIKHCVELVPREVSRALATATSAAGYTHLFLYRRRAEDRLLSLHFAKVSGIWGKRMKTERDWSQELLRQHRLPIAQLSAHERRCVAALDDAWNDLLSLGQAPSAVAFEDVYGAPSREAAEQLLVNLVADMALPIAGRDMAEWRAEVIGQGDQGTRTAYDQFPGRDELSAAVARLEHFVPAPPLVQRLVDATVDAAHWVRWARLDASGPVVARSARLEGVLVLAPGAPRGLRLRLEREGRVDPVRWGIRSRWAEQKYPDSPNAAQARFTVADSGVLGRATLFVEDPATGERQVGLAIDTAAPSGEALVERALALQGESNPERLAVALRRELDRLLPAERSDRWGEARQATEVAAR